MKNKVRVSKLVSRDALFLLPHSAMSIGANKNSFGDFAAGVRGSNFRFSLRKMTASMVGLALAFVVLMPVAASSNILSSMVLSTISTSNGSGDPGYGHSLVINASGVVFASGANYDGKLGLGTGASLVTTPTAVAGLLAGKEIIAVSAGHGHSLALDSDGAVYAWGNNSDGQLGDGTTTNSSVPVAVDASGVLDGKKIVSIAAGPAHSLALDSHGVVYAWGSNNDGQLGDGTTTSSSVPVAVYTLGVLAGEKVATISAGGEDQFGFLTGFNIATTEQGQVVAWGRNDNGQLGDGSTTHRSSPVLVTASGVLAGKSIIRVSAGGVHTLAIDSNGVGYGWGENARGQVGDGTTIQRTAPVLVDVSGSLSGKSLLFVSAGSEYSVFVDTAGSIYSVGANNYGQLGDGTTTNRSLIAASANLGLTSGETTAEIVAGNNSVLVRTSAGRILGWGSDRAVQLGTGVGETIRTPNVLNFQGGLDELQVADVFFGWTSTAFLTTTGKIFMVGDNGYSNLGDGTTTTSSLPIAPLGSGGLLNDKTFVDISIGIHHVLALDENGTVYSWGRNSFGQLGRGNTVSPGNPAVVGGVLVGKNIVAIATGGYHSLALDSAGVLYSWGYNNKGQLGVGSTTNQPLPTVVSDPAQWVGSESWEKVGGGDGHTIAVDSTGKVHGFGFNFAGQVGDGTTTDRNLPTLLTGALAGKVVTDISVGMYHNLALDNQGAVFGWGENNSGEVGNGTRANATAPVALAGDLSGKTITSISAGHTISFALDQNGVGYGWGANDSKQLAVDSIVNHVQTPSALSDATAIGGKVLNLLTTNRNKSTSARDSTGVFYGWGENVNGRLGIGNTLFYSGVKSTLFSGQAVQSSSQPAAPYLGPVLNPIASGATIFPGSKLTLSGSRLGSVSKVTISGLECLVEVLASGNLSITLPSSLVAGVYDLEVFSEFGKLTVQDAISVSASKAVKRSLPQALTKRVTDSQVKVYAKNLVGAGKVQYFLNGKEIAWVRAADQSDPKLRFANGASYLVRTLTLVEGQKNVIEIFVDGKRVLRRAASN